MLVVPLSCLPFHCLMGLTPSSSCTCFSESSAHCSSSHSLLPPLPYSLSSPCQVEYDPKFRLYLQTKLSNPHYKPEINAQTTLVNFCVTEKGLEDQLLALVVEHERPDLQEQVRGGRGGAGGSRAGQEADVCKNSLGPSFSLGALECHQRLLNRTRLHLPSRLLNLAPSRPYCELRPLPLLQLAPSRPGCNSVYPQARQLVRQLNEYNITLIDLENSLLFRLANSQGDILEDIELIENLEQTKVREEWFGGGVGGKALQ